MTKSLESGNVVVKTEKIDAEDLDFENVYSVEEITLEPVKVEIVSILYRHLFLIRAVNLANYDF